MKSVTIKDVAATLGLSYTTVSRVLNNAGTFPDETVKRVWDAANKLGYSPNQRARSLRAGNPEGRTNSNIILHITHQGQENRSAFLFEAEREQYLIQAALKKNLFCIMYRYRLHDGFRCPPVLNGHIDGILIGTPHIDIARDLAQSLPVVLIDVPFPSERLDGIAKVNFNERYAWEELLSKVKKKGFHKFAFAHWDYVGEEQMSMEYPQEMIYSILYSLKMSADLKKEIILHSPDQEIAVEKAAKELRSFYLKGEIDCVIYPSYPSILQDAYLALEGTSIHDMQWICGKSLEQFSETPGTVCFECSWPSLFETALDILKELIAGNKLPVQEYLIKPEIHLESLNQQKGRIS